MPEYKTAYFQRISNSHQIVFIKIAENHHQSRQLARFQAVGDFQQAGNPCSLLKILLVFVFSNLVGGLLSIRSNQNESGRIQTPAHPVGYVSVYVQSRGDEHQEFASPNRMRCAIPITASGSCAIITPPANAYPCRGVLQSPLRKCLTTVMVWHPVRSKASVS